MIKDKLIRFVKGTFDLYKKDSSPTEVYLSFIKNPEFKPLLNKVLTGKDVIIYSFMIPRYKDNLDLGGLYDMIRYYLTAFQIVFVDVHHPKKECGECNGTGEVDCSECNGMGEVDCGECNGSGQQECEDCGGDGYDDEGGGCSTCNGNGEVDCSECGGDGSLRCTYCGSDGLETCSECNGKGEITAYDESKIEKMKFVTYHPQVSSKLEGMEEGDLITSEEYDILTDSKYSIFLESFEDYSDDSIFLNVEEESYVFETELRNPTLELSINNRVYIRWKREF
jgi:hypothetical protein